MNIMSEFLVRVCSDFPTLVLFSIVVVIILTFEKIENIVKIISNKKS